jgi:probable rRNA maturation factor
VYAAALATLEIELFPHPPSVAILLTGDQHMQDLNLMYRGIDSATDVLSFPAGNAMPGMEEVARHLGDIVISVPFAIKQADAGGHDTLEELQLLTVHGLLHLLGYGHADAGEKRRMWLAQGEIMETLGIGQIEPTEEDHAPERAE